LLPRGALPGGGVRLAVIGTGLTAGSALAPAGFLARLVLFFLTAFGFVPFGTDFSSVHP